LNEPGYIVGEGKLLDGRKLLSKKTEPGFPGKRRTTRLYSIAVDFHHHRGRHAKFMIEKTITYLKDHRVKNIYLHIYIYPANKGAISLYKSLGFKFIRVTKGINPKRNLILLMGMG
jgi:ribosomal protein S18 acetylase RimI-like enzyme